MHVDSNKKEQTNLEAHRSQKMKLQRKESTQMIGNSQSNLSKRKKGKEKNKQEIKKCKTFKKKNQTTIQTFNRSRGHHKQGGDQIKRNQ